MKYYVVLLVTFKNKEADKVAIYAYDSEEKAIKAFYTYMGQYIAADNVATVCVEAKNNVGGIYKNEYWAAPAPTPEPTPEPESNVEEQAEE